MNSFWEMAPLFVMFIVTAYIVKIILDHQTRKKLIEKEMLDENVKYLYADRSESQVLSSLKWGMILIGIGIAVFVGQIAPPGYKEEVTIGGMFILAGLGLVIYYAIAHSIMKNAKGKDSDT